MFNVSGLSLIQLTTALKINLYLGLSFTRESDTHQLASKHRHADTCPRTPGQTRFRKIDIGILRQETTTLVGYVRPLVSLLVCPKITQNIEIFNLPINE